jgi:hypothetical protein
MTIIKFTGHWSGNAAENAAMKLTPGKRYVIKEYYECEGDGCPTHNLLPRIANDDGELIELLHGEYIEVSNGDGQ